MAPLAQPRAAALPPLVIAVRHHTDALMERFATMCRIVKLRRTYRMVDGKPVVTLKFRCDEQSDQLRVDEQRVRRDACDTLRYLGFFADVTGPCEVTIKGYYGAQVAA